LHTFKTSGITWFLEDEPLERVVQELAYEPAQRRVHLVREYEHGKVFIKFFREKGLSGQIRNRILPRGKKEYELSKKLRSLSIPTPKPLGYGVAPQGSYLVQEWIEGVPLLDWVENRNKREQLLVSLVTLLARLKSAGFRHNDLHLANMIASSDEIYLVDLHKGAFKKNFTVGDDVSNVSHALAILYESMDEREKEWFFKQYGGDALRVPVEKELARLRQRWVERKAERAFRTTSLLERSGNRITVRSVDGEIHGAYLATIKKDKKVKVERYADHLRKTYVHRRRLHRAWKHHVILEYMRFFITPRPYYAEGPSTSGPGYIAMEDLTGKGEELDRFLDRNYDGMEVPARRAFIGRLSLFFVSVLKKKIFHADLKACNIFVLQKGSFLFLDVEDLNFSGFDDAAIKRMLVQLNTTIPQRIPIGDRLRFFTKITEGLLPRPERKCLLKEIISESLQSEIVYEGVSGLKREAWK